MMTWNTYQMHRTTPENSFQIFNQQRFQVPKATFLNIQSPNVPPPNSSSPAHSSKETDYAM